MPTQPASRSRRRAVTWFFVLQRHDLDELETRAARQWLHAQHHFAELPGVASLLLVATGSIPHHVQFAALGIR
jgi:ferric-dicitrate binding protein FerR (iron transport regulator)